MPTTTETVKRKLNSDVLVLAAVLCVTLLSALICAWQLRQLRFARGTELLGLDCGGLDPAQAAQRLADAAGQRTLSLRDAQGAVLGELSLADLLGDADWPAAAEAARQAQRWGGDPSAAFSLPDAAALLTPLETALCGQGFVPEEPQSARLLLDEQGARIQPDTPGNIPELAVCAQAVAEYLRQGGFLAPDAPAELAVEGALRRPAVTADDDALQRALARVERCLAQSLTVEFCGGLVHSFTAAELTEVLRTQTPQGRALVTVDSQALGALLDAVVEELGADGTAAKYGRVYPTRETVTIPPGDEGYLLDRERLCKDTARAILLGRGGAVKARYDYTSWLQKTYGGEAGLDNVIEISLDDQYLWLYQDGELVVETPVTTGCVATRDETRRGSFRITYLIPNTFLEGPTWYFHVDYWIPFDGDIGLHDSAWRTEYGGDHYLKEGSHGCVNTPLEAMRVVFENSYYRMPVIVW